MSLDLERCGIFVGYEFLRTDKPSAGKIILCCRMEKKNPRVWEKFEYRERVLLRNRFEKHKTFVSDGMSQSI